jgi:hypothetical protein
MLPTYFNNERIRDDGLFVHACCILLAVGSERAKQFCEAMKVNLAAVAVEGATR